MKFQLVVYTPFQLLDMMIQTVKDHSPELNIIELRKLLSETMKKLYQVEEVIFMYTPSHMALACLDIALTQLSNGSPD